MKSVWLPKAIENRDAQLDFIAQDNVSAAIEHGDRIAHQVDQLAAHPELGRAGRKQGTRELVISRTPFIAVYRVRPKAQRNELLRLLHSSLKWPTAKVLESLADPRPNVEHGQVMSEAQAVIDQAKTKTKKGKQ